MFEFSSRARRRLLRKMLSRHYVTTPTSILKRLTGQETWPDPVTFSGGITNISLSTLAIAAATTTLTLAPATHAGKTLLIASTGGLAITPPPATGTFNIYKFLVITTISGGNFTFDAKAGNASDVIAGIVDTNKVGTLSQWGTAANSNLFTFNGTTLGGIAGDTFEFTDVGTNLWRVWGVLSQSGTAATPFSNH